MTRMAGFPFWEVDFDKDGKPEHPEQIAALRDGVAAQGLTDLICFSHGWNNDLQMALNIYERFFDLLRDQMTRISTPPARSATIGTAGIVWPSLRWADEATVAAVGAADLAAPPSAADLVLALKAVFVEAAQQQALDSMAQLLTTQPDDPAELARFQALMATLTTSAEAGAPEDNGEQALLTTDPQKLFGRFAALAPRMVDMGGAAGLGDTLGRLWQGAKQALRAATYWEMKKRAGVMGAVGLGPLLGQLQAARPGVKVHLIGHSFGARVVSFALAGLPNGTQSPVGSVTLLQGAFSHFAFAGSLPQDPQRGGALAGMHARSTGPLLVTHSVHDTANAQLYPLASLASGDDASSFDDQLFRWGAMGYDGAQAVAAADLPIGPVGQAYPFAAGRFTNLNGDAVIAAMEPISGAHGDIFHPEIAWAALLAMGIAAE